MAITFTDCEIVLAPDDPFDGPDHCHLMNAAEMVKLFKDRKSRCGMPAEECTKSEHPNTRVITLAELEQGHCRDCGSPYCPICLAESLRGYGQ